MTDPIRTAREAGRTALTEAETKQFLANVGISVPEVRVAESVDAAVDAAAEIGYPVVVKVSSPEIQHKSDWGDGAGVALGLESDDAVTSAAERIFATGEDEGIDVSILVEEAFDIDRGTEMIVGGVRDPSFGPTILVGLGGVFTEVLGDVSHRLAPIDSREARSMIDDLQGRAILSGYRDSPPVDLDALASTIVTVGDLLDSHEEIAEIEINPALATDEGAIALDGLAILAE